ncbi:virion structural protein [Shewanella phage S0112]|nr:virion structural protein [Shewanella phage S0112]
MAYETGSAINPADLLDKLSVFAVANGFTLDALRLESGRQTLYLNKNGEFYSMQFIPSTSTQNSYIQINLATGFVSGATFGLQPNSNATLAANTRCHVNHVLNEAIPTYHFAYLDGGILTVVMLMATGNYATFGFGEIEKYAPFTGGGIVLGTMLEADSNKDHPEANTNVYYATNAGTTINRRTWLHAEVDGIYMWQGYQGQPSPISGTAGYFDMSAAATYRTNYQVHSLINGFTGAARTAPVTIFLKRKDGLNKATPLGYLRDVRLFNMRDFDPGATFDSDWLVFPGSVKGDPFSTGNPTDFFNSGWYGFAIRIQ